MDTIRRTARYGWVGFALATYVGASCAGEVIIVTDSKHPVSAPPGTRILLLDTPARLKAALSAQLPTDPERAAVIVRQRLQAGGNGLRKDFQQAYQDVTEAWRLGVTKVPAVIVDRRYVVYGQTDVDAAIKQIQAYKDSNP